MITMPKSELQCISRTFHGEHTSSKPDPKSFETERYERYEPNTVSRILLACFSDYAAPRELSLEDDTASRDSPKVTEFRLETALVDEGQPDSTGTSSGGGKHALICQILALAIPALASMSVDHFMSAVDTAYIGQLSPDLGGGKVGSS